jgi:hypothetical protein
MLTSQGLELRMERGSLYPVERNPGLLGSLCLGSELSRNGSLEIPASKEKHWHKKNGDFQELPEIE